jgi:2-C-methyl-D-erythritol 4-phosphate cytidylyltransferase/2-C-methyl-D-erythritol 2,4-cyclodiphosphate synthase
MTNGGAVGVIIAAAGRGLRFGAAEPKQLIDLAGKSLLRRSVDAFLEIERVSELVVVVPADLAGEAARHLPEPGRVPVRVVAGGARRQDSVAAGFRALSPSVEVVLVHDAARPFVTREVIARTIDAAARHGAAVAAVAASDTVKRARPGDLPFVAETLPRETIHLAQTPQGFTRAVLASAIALGERGAEATDEARLAELAGYDVCLVDGDARNIKVTTDRDRDLALALAALQDDNVMPVVRIGIGYDSHRLVTGRPLVLGGVRIPFDQGLAGHSDADAIAHAVTDAVLGAASMGDIGQLFPDTDPRWKDADSLALLTAAVARARAGGFRVGNVDVTVVAERPKLAPWRDAIRANLARALGCTPAQVSVKGKTNEGLDAIGRGEGVAVHAVALLMRA